MPTVRQLAQQMSDAFEDATRDDGTKYCRLEDGSPEWMTQGVIFPAHDSGDMLPDDWRYRFIREAIDAIAENEDIDDARGSATEPSIYNHELTAWLGSRADRFGYCDGAMEEYGIEKFPGTIELLQMGQAHERDEVFSSVLAALESLATDDDTEDESDAA